jgi:hypothetical protein
MTYPSDNSVRTAGIALLVYALGTAVAFFASGAPGGGYSDHVVATYISAGHFTAAAALWYLGALSALALLVVATGLRRLGHVGGLLSGLAITGTAMSVTGAFVSGGVAVAMAEGGAPVRAGVPHPVVYTLTEIGNLLAVCGPALCIGVAAVIVAARTPLPAWQRTILLIGGISGILAPLFFTYFLFMICVIISGVAAALKRPRVRSARIPAAQSLV